jgi:hypothetical protein
MGKFGNDLIESMQQAAGHARGRKVRGMRVRKVEVPKRQARSRAGHPRLKALQEVVDGRDKPGHDEST